MPDPIVIGFMIGMATCWLMYTLAGYRPPEKSQGKPKPKVKDWYSDDKDR